jgi:tripartite-type tricarboxylate transporter receptor subunit TctC
MVRDSKMLARLEASAGKNFAGKSLSIRTGVHLIDMHSSFCVWSKRFEKVRIFYYIKPGLEWRKPMRFPAAISLSLLSIMFLLPGSASAQAPFYQGKTITIVAGTAPGGAGDHRTKALVPFLRKHIPGNPTIVVEHKSGGGRQAANYMYQTAKADGLTVGSLGGSIVALNILGATGVMYDIDKFVYLGSSESTSHQIMYTRKELALGNLEKLRAASGIRIGAQAVGHPNYMAGRIFAYLLGLREPKFIVGYSTPELEVALLRGEIDGRANNVAQLLHRNPDWVEKKVMDIHGILEIPKGAHHPRFGHVPEIETFARSNSERNLLSIYRTLRLVGAPYALPPGTPKDNVAILQDAMRKAFKDPDFHREYKKLTGEEPDPLMPEEMEKVVREMPRDAEAINLLKTLSGEATFPTR